MPKRPGFVFYPDDWMNDLNLRLCSPTARAIWLDLMCLMHQGVPYGHLAVETGEMEVSFLASKCSVSRDIFELAIAELESRKVFSRSDDGVIYSRKMVRDELVRNRRAIGGHKSLLHPNVPRKRPAGPEDDIDEGTDEGCPSRGEREESIDSTNTNTTLSLSPTDKTTGNNGTPKKRLRDSWKLDEGYLAFASVWREHVPDAMDLDFAENHHNWRTLDFDQQQLATANVTARADAGQRIPFLSMWLTREYSRVVLDPRARARPQPQDIKRQRYLEKRRNGSKE